MKRLILLTAALLCLFAQGLNAQMTDSQVVDYVKDGVAAGKSETQIGMNCLRGASPESRPNVSRPNMRPPAPDLPSPPDPWTAVPSTAVSAATC